MRFLIAADIVYQLMSTTHELNQRSFGMFQENNYSTHKSAARESTNMYTTECIYPKDQAPKHTTGGLSQKCVEVTPNGPGPHCIAKLSTNPPSQVYLPTDTKTQHETGFDPG